MKRELIGLLFTMMVLFAVVIPLIKAIVPYRYANGYDYESQGLVTSTAPAHAAVTWIDHETPLRKGDKLKGEHND